MKELYKAFGKEKQEVKGMFSIANIFYEMGKETNEGKQKKELSNADKNYRLNRR